MRAVLFDGTKGLNKDAALGDEVFDIGGSKFGQMP